MNVEIYETSKAGNHFEKIEPGSNENSDITIELNADEKFQTITGFGGSFTEASCYLLNQLSDSNKTKILNAYFSESEANYSLCRTTIASCDFSLNNYTSLKHEKFP
jgi:glucosylceramidase